MCRIAFVADRGAHVVGVRQAVGVQDGASDGSGNGREPTPFGVVQVRGRVDDHFAAVAAVRTYRSANSDALLADLKAGRIDAAALVRPQSGGSSRLAWQNLAKQFYVMLAPPGTDATPPQELLQRLGLIQYDTSLTGGRIAARYVRRTFAHIRAIMEVRSIDAIVAMVAAGLGVSIVPQPRAPLLGAHGVRALSLGRSAPTRQIALVRRRADVDDRNIDALHAALAAAYADRVARASAGREARRSR